MEHRGELLLEVIILHNFKMFYYTILAFALLFFSIFLDAFTIQTFSPFDNFFEAILSGGQNSCLHFYNQLFLLSSLPFIPWKITSSSVNAQNALIKFYESQLVSKDTRLDSG